jgi:hypothetical protein
MPVHGGGFSGSCCYLVGGDPMKRLLLFSVTLLVAFGLSVPRAVADLEVQVGYADNLRASPFFPTPWCGAAGTTFDGSSANGGCGMTFDSGAIRLINNGASSISVTDVSVNIGGVITDIWNAGGAFSIAPGTSAILAQTGQFNFDSSDIPGITCCSNDGIIPTVTITFDGKTVTLNDSAQVLNTSGFDFACSAGCFNTNESFRWRDIGTVGGQAGNTPEPSSMLLMGSGLLSLCGIVRRKFQV